MILKVNIEMKTMEQTMHSKNEPVLTYRISYPEFSSAVFFKNTQKLSAYYRRRAAVFESYCRTALYRMAVETAEEMRKAGYPVLKFEAVEEFNVTYNENCALSLYFDRYLFTGGAHGTTERTSDTWELNQNGKRVGMDSLFPENFDYEGFVMGEVVAQIREQMENGGMYFENYEQNVADTFQKENFYLTEYGLTVYFQQYDIAPYAAGIPQFLLPYRKNGPMPPRC